MSDAGSDRATSSLDTEEVARANLYGLVSRLFYGPADPNLLAEISRGGPGGEEQDSGGRALVTAWRSLQEACRGAYPALVRQEYDSLFVGVGKAPVTPYLSAYAEPNSPERYLVRLREQLSVWGLARRQSVFEVEDHVSGLNDVMRWLIETRRPPADQQWFFESFAYPGAAPFFAAAQNAPSANFYKLVAAFSLSFFQVEKAAFEMEEMD